MAANKVALVTGAAGGMGMATVKRLVSDGFTVAAMDMNAKGLAELGKALGASNGDWRVGWTAGGGIEYALARNWTIRAEYLHIDLGHADISALASDGNTYTWRSHLTDDVVRMGVNYRF